MVSQCLEQLKVIEQLFAENIQVKCDLDLHALSLSDKWKIGGSTLVPGMHLAMFKASRSNMGTNSSSVYYMFS